MSEWKETDIGIIPGDWSIQLSRSYCPFITDGTHDSPKRQSSGYPLITSKHIKGHSIDFENAYLISEKDYFDIIKRSRVEQYDLIISMIGEYCGFTYLETSLNIEYAVKNVGLLKNKDLVNARWLMYYLSSTIGNHQLQLNRSGTSQPYISLTALRCLPIVVPSSEGEKKAITDVLVCLDRAIENLRKQNETLEQIAQTLFKHWFIDFEFPNADGQPYKSSGGEMVPSELGDIPVGWRVGKLGDIGKNIKAGISEDDIQPEMSYIALEHMPRKQIALDSWETAADIASNKLIFKKGNILFGKLRPYFHKVGVAFISGICSTDILVLDSKREDAFGFLLMIVSSDELIRYVSLAAEGTRMPRTSWQYMKDYPICIPENSTVKAFNDLLKVLIAKIEKNVFQIQTLTQTRDTLLPKLMSGQLRVQP